MAEKARINVTNQTPFPRQNARDMRNVTPARNTAQNLWISRKEPSCVVIRSFRPFIHESLAFPLKENMAEPFQGTNLIENTFVSLFQKACGRNTTGGIKVVKTIQVFRVLVK